MEGRERKGLEGGRVSGAEVEGLRFCVCVSVCLCNFKVAGELTRGASGGQRSRRPSLEPCRAEGRAHRQLHCRVGWVLYEKGSGRIMLHFHMSQETLFMVIC